MSFKQVESDTPPSLIFSKHGYDCLQCGKSCSKQWRILVDPDSKRRLESTEIYQLAVRRGYKPLKQVDQPTGWHELCDASQKTSDESPSNCHFFANSLCQVHSSAGPEMKPRVCQQFPFLPLETPAGIFIGLSFRCTAVQANHGGSLESHREQLERLITGAKYRKVGFGAIPLNSSEQTQCDWESYLSLESGLMDILNRASNPLDFLAKSNHLLPLGTDPTNGLREFFADLEGGTQVQDAFKLAWNSWTELSNYLSPRFQIPIRPGLIRDFLQSDFQGIHKRYLWHLLERKFLLLGDSIESQLQQFHKFSLGLLAVTYALQPWTDRSAHYALEIVEGEFVEHPSSRGPSPQAEKSD